MIKLKKCSKVSEVNNWKKRKKVSRNFWKFDLYKLRENQKNDILKLILYKIRQ